jgi:hypothetical protein
MLPYLSTTFSAFFFLCRLPSLVLLSLLIIDLSLSLSLIRENVDTPALSFLSWKGRNGEGEEQWC